MRKTVTAGCSQCVIASIVNILFEWLVAKIRSLVWFAGLIKWLEATYRNLMADSRQVLLHALQHHDQAEG